jgi:hypothetical protein
VITIISGSKREGKINLTGAVTAAGGKKSGRRTFGRR